MNRAESSEHIARLQREALEWSGLSARPILLRHRPITVEAMKVETNNLYLVGTWCGGKIAADAGVWIVTDTGDPAFAHIGHWVVRGPAGFYPATDEALWAGYEAVL